MSSLRSAISLCGKVYAVVVLQRTYGMVLIENSMNFAS
nr:MAG TPA: hypothetical protein [Caudoviricetes sp.]